MYKSGIATLIINKLVISLFILDIIQISLVFKLMHLFFPGSNPGSRLAFICYVSIVSFDLDF